MAMRTPRAARRCVKISTSNMSLRQGEEGGEDGVGGGGGGWPRQGLRCKWSGYTRGNRRQLAIVAMLAVVLVVTRCRL